MNTSKTRVAAATRTQEQYAKGFPAFLMAAGVILLAVAGLSYVSAIWTPSTEVAGDALGMAGFGSLTFGALIACTRGMKKKPVHTWAPMSGR